MSNRARELRDEIKARFQDAREVGRTRNSVRHELEPGRYALDASIGSLHYQNGETWQDIETAVTDSVDAEFTDEADRLPYRFRGRGNGTRRLYPRRDVLDEYIEFGRPQARVNTIWTDIPFSSRTRTEDQLVFERDNAQLRVTITPDRLKVDFVLKDVTAARPLRFPLSMTGLTREDRQLRGADGVIVAEIPKPILIDAVGIERDIATSFDGVGLIMTADVAGLTYPIALDPTLDVAVNASVNDGIWQEANTSFAPTSLNWYPGGHLSTAGGAMNSFARFANVTVPNAVTITAAYVRMRANETTSTTTVNAIWSAIDADNAAAPTTYTGAQNATRTTATVAQNNLPAWTSGTDYDSPSLVPVAQEIVDRPLWASGNAITIYAEDNGSTAINATHRRAHSYDSSSTLSPKLHIEYTTNTAPTISVAPSVSYGTLTRLGPNNTPSTVTFTTTDLEQTTAGALSYTIRTAASGAGTLVGSGTNTSGTAKVHSITNADTGLVDGTQTLYLRVYDGTAYSTDFSFTLLRDTGAPTVGTITTNPDPVVN